MEKQRAIPQGYMTVGEVAKKMNTTVRTLQYYDKEGLLVPSAASEGGRRLYTNKDLVMLHQIQSLKYLGFSLDDIKTRLISLNTPRQVADALTGQANAVKEKIASLSEVLETIEKLRTETLQMQTVNFRKYADIVTMLQSGEQNYWVVKGMSDELWSYIRDRFDEQSAKVYTDKQKKLFEEVAALKNANISPDSEQGLQIGKTWWELLLEFTDGDLSLLPEMMKFGENRTMWDDDWKRKWENAEGYITEALAAYLSTLEVDPFAGITS